jgi:hypothetical protein
MKFHNRALPYPILDTTDELRQDFFDGDFQVVVDEVINEDEDRLTLTVLYSCSVHEIEELVRTGKAAYTMLIISPSTMVRRAFTSLSHRQEIDISILDFYGQVELLPQIVVTDRIQGFSSEDLHEEYRDIAFDLFPGDVLAVADSETRTFEFEGLKLESDDSAREKRWAPGILKLVEETGLRLDGASLTELNVIAQQILKGDTVERLKKRYLGDRS